MNWGRLSKTSMRSAMFKQGTFTKWQTVSLLYLQSDAFNCLAWFSLDLELILFDYLKYFGTELKNVQCQLVFVWGGRRLSRVTGEAGEKFTRKVYITRILMLITGINTAQICFLHKQIFLQFRDHISQSSIHHRWYICLHRETVQLFNV